MDARTHRERINALREKLNLVSKEAFVPPGQMPPEAMDPGMAGAPMDPAMAGQMPPEAMDPGMRGGAPMDPAMAGQMPPEAMDPGMMGGADPFSMLIERVDILGMMLIKIIEALQIPLDDLAGDAPAADAAAQMAPEMAPDIAAQEAQQAQQGDVLSDQANQALSGFQGYQ